MDINKHINIHDSVIIPVEDYVKMLEALEQVERVDKSTDELGDTLDELDI